MCLHAFAHEEVAAIDVLRSLMMFWVVSKIDGRLLPIDSGVGSSLRMPRSARRVRRYTASLVASEAAMISALQDDNATEGCFFDAQETAA
eukprot:1068375-Pleurochrysis_carterae.AAC.1